MLKTHWKRFEDLSRSYIRKLAIQMLGTIKELRKNTTEFKKKVPKKQVTRFKTLSKISISTLKFCKQALG